MRVDIAVSSPPGMEADFRAAFYASDKRDPGGGIRMVKEESVTCVEFALVFWRVRSLRQVRGA